MLIWQMHLARALAHGEVQRRAAKGLLEERYARDRSALAHAHRLQVPFVVDRTLELEGPRMRQISQPLISRMLDHDLD